MIARAPGRLLLALALLAGLQAALEHPLRHVNASGEYAHLHDGHSHDRERSGESAPGTQCDTLAALTACAPDAAPPLVARAQITCPLAVRNERAPRAADAPPFLAQGPPASA